MSAPWYESRFTGLFTRFGEIPLRPHDPQVPICAGTLPAVGARREELAVGGAAWEPLAAVEGCVGEAIERWQPYALPHDQFVESSADEWPLDEPAVEPGRWVLFHPQQYAQAGFPFQPFTSRTHCRWVCFREAGSGKPYWVPEELAFLYLPPPRIHRLGTCVSTGLACSRFPDQALLRGLQEVIERDAVMGAWWDRYPLEEWPRRHVLRLLGPEASRRIVRPNLSYRFFRIDSPYAAHVTLVALEGEDEEGYCFSIGAACRETRRAGWEKATLEAVQGRHYIRFLKPRAQAAAAASADTVERLTSFADHAVYYSLYPERLSTTVLARPGPPDAGPEDLVEGLRDLIERLGAEHLVLFRNLTPGSLAQQFPDWIVTRVLVPGLQPLHGNHHLPHLGGKLWAPRTLAEWATSPPHPFP